MKGLIAFTANEVQPDGFCALRDVGKQKQRLLIVEAISA
jgi:hypothetical protein